MTNEDKNIKICEWLGWKRVAPMAGVQWGASATKDKLWMFAHQLPNHFTDLNAMHEAEKYLQPDKIESYTEYLVPDKMDWIKYPKNAWWKLFHATASQRAEAFGKTLNLW